MSRQPTSTAHVEIPVTQQMIDQDGHTSSSNPIALAMQEKTYPNDQYFIISGLSRTHVRTREEPHGMSRPHHEFTHSPNLNRWIHDYETTSAAPPFILVLDIQNQCAHMADEDIQP